MGATKKQQRSGATGRKKSRSGFFKNRYLQHRYIVSLEALLVVQLILDEGERMMLAQAWSHWLQILIIMLMTVGVLGWFVIMIQHVTEKWVAKAERIVAYLPIPRPLLCVHLCIFVLLFIAFAWQMGMLDSIRKDVNGLVP